MATAVITAQSTNSSSASSAIIPVPRPPRNRATNREVRLSIFTAWLSLNTPKARRCIPPACPRRSPSPPQRRRRGGFRSRRGLSAAMAAAAGSMLIFVIRLPFTIWYSAISLREKHSPVPMALPRFSPLPAAPAPAAARRR